MRWWNFTKFKIISGDPFATLLKNEGKVNRYLNQLLKENIIDEKVYRNLYSSGSRPGILYGLPKIHKENNPIRPILSAIGTFNYKLAKFLVPIIAPITINEFTVKDTFEFVKNLCDSNLPSNNVILASFDIKSLFTNIPLSETIDICTNELFANSDYVHNFSKVQFKKLLNLACKDCYFLFDETLYQQTDGVAMGNPLGPTLANAFLCYHEKQWLGDCPSDFKPITYKRYVDDTFLIFKSPDDVNQFLDYLNDKHPNIKFTSEIENNRCLPFLDINIKRVNNSFTTSVYRKPTFTGLMTKFSSAIPNQYKKNLVTTLVIRAYNICSNYFDLHDEFKFLEQTLFKNGFSVTFTCSVIKRQLNKLLKPSCRPATANKAIVYFSIPYKGNTSFTLRKSLTKLLMSFYPQVTIRVVFKPNSTIQNYFNIKDKIPIELRSSVIYLYQCRECNLRYLGQTGKHLKERISNHLGISSRTQQPLAKPPHSAVRDHSHAKDHPIHRDSQNFR